MAPTFIKSLTFSTIASDNSNKSTPNYYLDSPIQISEGYAVKSFQGVNTVYNIDSRIIDFLLMNLIAQEQLELSVFQKVTTLLLLFWLLLNPGWIQLEQLFIQLLMIL